MSSTQSRLADLALVAYLAPLVAGRRVGVVGTRSGEVALRARALGAASVVCFGGVGEGLAVRALVPGAIAGFQGRLDVLVVPDGNALPSLVAVLDEARRALGSEGVVVVSSEPPEGPPALEPSAGGSALGYHALHELCARRFAHVQMLGRGPFAGYLLASLDAEASAGVSLETRLIDGDPPHPEAFVAVASDCGAAVDPLTVVQLPEQFFLQLRDGAAAESAGELGRLREKLKEVEAASAERWVKIQRYEHGLKELEEDNRKQRDRAVRLSKELEDERKLRQRIELESQMNRRAPELPKGPDPELDRLRGELARRDQELAAVRSQVAALESQRRAAEEEAASARAAGDASKGQREALQAEAKSLRSELGVATAAVSAAKAESRDLGLAAEALRREAAGLRRELDETQASEAELQEQLAAEAEAHAAVQREVGALSAALQSAEEALGAARLQHRQALSDHDAMARAERAHLEADYATLEHALSQRAEEVIALRAAVARGEGALRELLFEAAAATPASHLADEATLSVLRAERDAAQASLGAAQALAARATALETELLSVAGEAQQARWQADELGARLARVESDLLAARETMVQSIAVAPAATAVEGPSDAAGLASLQRELEALEAREARLSGALRGMSARAEEAELALRDVDGQLGRERVALEQQRLATHEARGEVSRLYAINLGLEARLVHAGLELEGVRASGSQREADLQAEVDRLFRALEVAGTQAVADLRAELASRESDFWALTATQQGAGYRLCEAESAVAAVSADARRALMAQRAEAQGMALRLQEAESAVAALTEALGVTRGRAAQALRDVEIERDALLAAASAPPSLLAAADGEGASQARVDQMMADLADTVARLAQTEEALAGARDSAVALEQALATERAHGASQGMVGELDALRVECAALRSRVEADREQAAANDGRLQALVVQLDDRDRLVVSLERRLRDEVDALAQMNLSLKQALEQVRARIADILVDGRGALVSHDLLGVLRAIEGVGA